MDYSKNERIYDYPAIFRIDRIFHQQLQIILLRHNINDLSGPAQAACTSAWQSCQ